MIRIQIRMSEKEYEAAKHEASRLGISVAELVRRAVRPLLPADESKPWMKYAGFVQSCEPLSSRTIDEVLYRQ